VQRAGGTLSHSYDAIRSQSPHGEPSRLIDHFDGGADLTVRLVPFCLGGERFAVEVEDD
jgi:hypothetical protein